MTFHYLFNLPAITSDYSSHSLFNPNVVSTFSFFIERSIRPCPSVTPWCTLGSQCCFYLFTFLSLTLEGWHHATPVWAQNLHIGSPLPAEWEHAVTCKELQPPLRHHPSGQHLSEQNWSSLEKEGRVQVQAAERQGHREGLDAQPVFCHLGEDPQMASPSPALSKPSCPLPGWR